MSHNNNSKSPINILAEFCSKSKLNMRMKETSINFPPLNIGISFEIEGISCRMAVGFSKKEMKINAAIFAINKLKEDHYEINYEIDEETHPNTNHNASSLLAEYCGMRKIILKFECEKSTQRGYEGLLYISSQLVAKDTGLTKKLVKRKCMAKALTFLINKNRSKILNLSTEEVFQDMGRRIAYKCGEIFHKFILLNPQYALGNRMLAGILVEDTENDQIDVLAIGTGNNHIVGEHLSLNGCSINDSHAEVIVRRAFLKLLYSEIKDFHRSGVECRLLQQDSDNQFRLRIKLRLHFYVSNIPCGVASKIAKQTDSNEVPVSKRVRTKIERGEGTKDSTSNVLQTWDGIFGGNRLMTMSCSDKILKWNVLGLQGSLLGNFVEPIFLSSIVIVTSMEHAVMYRAFMGRYSDLRSLSIHTVYTDEILKPQNLQRFSLNWFSGDSVIESVDGMTGFAHASLPDMDSVSTLPTKNRPSRLSKREFLKDFDDVLESSKMCFDGYVSKSSTYLDAKNINKSYKIELDHFKKNISDCEFGYWISKPEELSMFTTN